MPVDSFQRPLSPSSLPPQPGVGRHQLWLDDTDADLGQGTDSGFTLRLDPGALSRVPPSSIGGPLRAAGSHPAWPAAADEPPTLSVRRASIRIG